MPESAIVLLAFDFGLRHIGVAAGQTLTATARGVTTLAAKQGKPKWREIEKLISEYRPHRLLVGLPLNLDDSHNDISDAATRFATRLSSFTGLPTELHDERLTTKAAKNALQEARELGMAKTDHELAACLILLSWFNEHSPASNAPE